MNKAKAEINMLRDKIEMRRGGKRKRATGGKQNAKRSQWAGRLVTDGAGNYVNLWARADPEGAR